MGIIRLTNCQQLTLVGLIQGLTQKEIARRYGFGVRSVAVHVWELKQRLGANSTAQIAVHAISLGLVDCPKYYEIVERIENGNKD